MWARADSANEQSQGGQRSSKVSEAQTQPTTARPLWVNRRQALALCAIPQRTFDAWARDGLVRSAKFGTSRQAARVYRLDDLDALMVALSEGRQLSRPVATRKRGVAR